MDQISLWWIWTAMKQKFQKLEEYALKTGCERFCMPIKGKSKNTKKRTCRLFTKNSSYWEKELDWHWTREIFFLRLWSIEESNVSSTPFTTSPSRRRWSSVFWENLKKNLQSQFPHSPHWSDGRWKVCVEGGRGDKRRFQYCTDASGTIVYVPSSSGIFRTQSYWSCITGQFGDSEQLLPGHLSCRMCNQFTLHHEFRIDTWCNRLGCTTSCTIPA